MNKVILILKREFISKVRKKSFLVATILIPLLVTGAIGSMTYFLSKEQYKSGPKKILVINQDTTLRLESNKNLLLDFIDKNVDEGIDFLNQSDNFGLLVVPPVDIHNPKGFVLYTKSTPSMLVVKEIENLLESNIKEIKYVKYEIDKEILSKLKTDVNIITKISDENKEDSNSQFASAIGYFNGFLLYMFMFIYGNQVMQGVIEEKNSKIVEIIVSTVKPFQFMLGKVLGVACVGLAQILIWVIIVSAIFYVTSFTDFSVQKLNEMSHVDNIQSDDQSTTNFLSKKTKLAELSQEIQNIPVTKILICFIIYFIGGYLLYGALFAAVGSAVNNASEASQFMLPIMLPIILGFIGLTSFVITNPNGTMSFWLSIIPLTSPIVMMGRIGFGVPIQDLVLSIFLLILGFIFTIWLAGRIYRVGILMAGSKVNYRILLKWILMKD